MVAHMAVSCGVKQSDRGFQCEQTWLCECVHGKCYRPAIDQIVI